MGQVYPGPSPRVWGERSESLPRELHARTIPTRVGRTQPPLRTAALPTDHPHACGENLRSWCNMSATCGPSPRVWGELRRIPQHIPSGRTIPTRVGRTTSELLTWYS